MKHYVILTPGIMDIGGAQMYIRNKVKYLQDIGYIVNVFHSGTIKGTLMIKDLSAYVSNSNFHIIYPVYHFSKKVRKDVMTNITRNIHANSEEIIIESHSAACATWGEYLSEKIRAKHIVFLLSEYNSIRNKGMYRFFKFKLERRELAGITEKTIPILFRKYEIIENSKSYNLLASCTNVVENIPYPLLTKIPGKDYIVGSIGRLNKLFVNDMLDDFIEFANQYPGKTYTFVFIGGEPNESNNKNIIERKFQNIKNVSLFFTGNLYPIPRDLVIMPDVFISSSGSCFVSSSLGIPTISIDSNDHKPIGIIGETTKNVIFREEEPHITLQELLNDILIKKKYHKNIHYDSKESPINFSEHMNFLYNSNNLKSYFDFKTIRLSAVDWIEKSSLFILGDYQIRRLSMRLLPLWNKIRIA